MTTHDPDMDRLISKVNHDAKNSLRALIEVPKWIVDDLEASGVVIPDDVRTHIGLLITHANRLDHMREDVTTFLRVGPPNGETVQDLDLFLSDQRAKWAIPTGFSITFHRQCDDVPMGRENLALMLSALVTNAIKHHDAQTGDVSVTIRHDARHCTIEVEDDGPGIAPADRTRVFAPLTTLHPRDEVEGSGMGLATVAKIVAQHGGTVAVHDGTGGQGSRFTIRLPR